VTPPSSVRGAGTATICRTRPGTVPPARPSAASVPGRATYTAILWEALIRHPLISVDLHREQLAAILEAGERQNVTVQVLPFSAGPVAGVTSAFQSFSFESEPTVEAVTLDNMRGASVLEAPEDLAAYANVFDHLRSVALAPDVSARLIQSSLLSKEDAS
jgi:hypothetical protein